MDILKDAWGQAGAIGLLIVGMMLVIWRQYKDGQAKDSRITEFGDRCLAAITASTEVIREINQSNSALAANINGLMGRRK